ncbi:hypothetical protein F4V43_00615 [Paenibacillus spiritus]|uniref:TATA-box binding protein n=1 Tax=Paenibacillus spiritus TaxID=2496557 RepID=A0A5J5GKD4_9BACL|nr:YwmB family TATA-box binding protein [Paenibacillus spiritus]KAA9008665.1 hypothetical protein F4V43_00615 [Paenibacillus spiritus]
MNKAERKGTGREAGRGKNRAKQDRRSGAVSGAVWLMLAVLVAAAFWGIGPGSRAGAESGGAEREAAGLPAALERLAALGRSAAAEGAPLRLVVKWQGEYDGPAGDRAAASLAAALNLRLVSQGEEDGHRTLRCGSAEDGVRVSLFWSELAGGSHYAIVTLETRDLAAAPGLPAAAAEAGAAMAAAGVRAEWNAAIQGESRKQGTPEEAAAGAEGVLAKLLPGSEALEQYEDAATVSRSYRVPGLERTVPGSKGELAAQIAVHRSSGDGRERVTIGLPLITVEY